MRPMKVWALPISGPEMAAIRVPWPLDRREFQNLMKYLRLWDWWMLKEEVSEGDADDSFLRWHEEWRG